MFGQNGASVIESVVGKFSVMKDKLEEGVAKCTEEVERNVMEVEEIKQKNTSLDSSIQKGRHVISKLREILGD